MKLEDLTNDLKKTTPAARMTAKKITEVFVNQEQQNQKTLEGNIDYIIKECNLKVVLTNAEKSLLTFNMMHCFEQFQKLDDPKVAWCNTNVIMMDILFKFHLNGGKYDSKTVETFVSKIDELTSPVSSEARTALTVLVIIYSTVGTGVMVAMGVDPILIGVSIASYIILMLIIFSGAFKRKETQNV